MRELDVARITQAVAELANLDANRSLYWQRRAALAAKLGPSFGAIEQAVQWVLANLPRASSLVENLNSRLRCYFFLWRRVSRPYLELLRFYLNHHPFARSQRVQRVGKSPAELLAGRPHPHWMQMLGHRLFRRN